MLAGKHRKNSLFETQYKGHLRNVVRLNRTSASL
jgi:hypothetical protein